MTISDSLQEAIAAVRHAVRASDKTLAAIAREVGINRVTLSRWMGGRNNISIETIDRVAEAVGVQVTLRPKVTQQKNSSE